MYQEIARNKRLSVIYVVVFFVFWAGMGALVGLVAAWFRTRSGGNDRYSAMVSSNAGLDALSGALIALSVATLATLVVLRFGTRLILRSAGARPADTARDAQLINLVEALAIGEGIPTPQVFVIDDPSPNAFATGTSPSNAAITVTAGLLRMMNREELEGVLAHEMSHIRISMYASSSW